MNIPASIESFVLKTILATLWVGLLANCMGNSLFAQSEHTILWQTNLAHSGKLYPTRNGGLLIAGVTTNNGNDWVLTQIDSNGNRMWQRMFGGTNYEYLSLVHKVDEGFILVGTSASEPSGNKTSPLYGENDIWVMQINENGEKLWERSFGGNKGEGAWGLYEFPGDGYLISGATSSAQSGNKTSEGFGGSDAWLVRIESSGEMRWDKTFGGNGDESGPIVIANTDGSAFIACTSRSGATGNKTSVNWFSWNEPYFGDDPFGDFWFIRINNLGEKTADVSYGGSQLDELSRFMRLPDGTFLMIGSSLSGISGNKTTDAGLFETWMVKISADGTKIWDQCVLPGGGDTFSSWGSSIDVLLGNGEMLIGSTTHTTYSPRGTTYSRVHWTGNIQPDGSLRTAAENITGLNSLRSGTRLAGGGYLFGGTSEITTPTGKQYDYAALKANGSTVIARWDFGGAATDAVYDVCQTTDGGYVLLGSSHSDASGQKTTPNDGPGHSWLVKLHGDRVVPEVRNLLGGRVEVSWPSSAQNFSLQYRVGYGPASQWTSMNFTPEVVNGRIVVTLSTSNEQRFYRLVK